MQRDYNRKHLGNMRLKKGYVLRDISGDKVIVGEGLEAVDFSSLLSLNETAAWLWKKAEEMGDFTPELLSEAICKEYEVSPETAYHDTVKIINRWMEEGLIKD